MPLDRHRVVAVEPVPSHLEQEAEHPHRVDRLVDAVPGKGLAAPDLHTDIGTVEAGERVLVGDVVAQIENGAGGGLHP